MSTGAGNIELSQDFEGAATGSGILSPDAVQSLTGQMPEQVNPYQYFETIYMQQCDESPGSEYAPERFYSYGIVIGFENEEDANAYRNHPQHDEIEQTIEQFIKSENEETLRLEVERDQNSEFYPDADQESFNSGTIEDFQVSIDSVIPQINATYDLNIQGGFVTEQSLSVPAMPFLCSGMEPIPENVASADTGWMPPKM